MKKFLPAMLAAALFASPANAQTKIGIRIYGAVNIDRSIGFDPGYGPIFEADVVNNRIGLRAEGRLSEERKNNAERGFTYEGIAALRYRVKGNWFAEGGVRYSGYSSEFDSGEVWAKHKTTAIIGAGYADDKLKAVLRFSPQEHQTVNETTTLQFMSDAKISHGKRLDQFLKVIIGFTSYTQGGERLNAMPWTVVGYGIGF